MINKLKEFFNLLSEKKGKAPLIDDSSKIRNRIQRNYQYRVPLDLNNLRYAVDAAKHDLHPDRQLLYNIYDLIIKDSHLASQLRTAEFKVLKAEFMLFNLEGVAFPNQAELLKKTWFLDFVKYCLEAEFWGHSLIEFGQLEDSQFQSVYLIPRVNVVPEKGIVTIRPGDYEGIDYRSDLLKFALIEVGDHNDLGILELASKEVIIKNYSRTDWSQSSEKFGMPRLVIRTDTQDEKEINEMETQAANFGTNGYIILNKEDECDLQTDPSTDRFKIYQENISLCDKEISKLINGQTGTTDEKAFVGSAQVHERILNKYTISRLRDIEFKINDKLIPFLINFGYPLEGLKLRYLALMKSKQKN